MNLVESIQRTSEWTFVWSIISTMPNDWASAEALRDRNDVFPQCDLFQYSDGEVTTAYISSSFLEHFKKIESAKYLDNNFYKKYVAKYEAEKKIWWRWAKSTEKCKYFSKSKVLNDYQRFQQYMRDAIAFFGSTRAEFTFAAEQRLKKLLEQGLDSNSLDGFEVITTPVKLDEIQRERLFLLKMKAGTKVELLRHATAFPWLVFRELSEEKVLENLRQKFLTREGDYLEELTKSLQRKRQLKTKQKQLFKRLGTSAKEAKYLANFLQEQAVRRMEVKAYWAGCYYLCRKMWKALAQICQVKDTDIITFLTPLEIQDYLRGGKLPLQKIIKERKKGFALDYKAGGDIKVLESKLAKKIFKQLSKPINKNSAILGQSAARGVYTGKVKKVIVGDLEMLRDSIKEFKRGEVLVTSMTQPNMMVIAKRAGAIVADEGGITSHAAIIARELGIPCIVGCSHAMKTLEDGDMVKVDANKGVVTRIAHSRSCD